jgi:hypothetical protein
MYDARYTTSSKSFAFKSSNVARREGLFLKYQVCTTGAASSICPIRSRRTLLSVISTPHIWHFLPVCEFLFDLLLQAHW